VADAAVIAAVANALRDWSAATGKAPVMKPLREAVWFYWESPRLPRPLIRSKYPRNVPWSALAREAHIKDGRGAALEIEHTLPMRMLQQQMLDAPTLDAAAVQEILAAGGQWVVLTQEEARALANAGVASDVASGDDPWSRYHAAGLDTLGFAPFPDSA
jgi:hypothetical protein